MKSISQKFNLIAIVGPTATGKSDLTVALAKKFNGEIVSADSRQVYKGMDIGSGKITKKEMDGVPHYLLDIVSPKTVYSAGRFKKEADKVIASIIERGKLPFLVGGTGFWIDSVTKNKHFPEVLADFELRKTLDALKAEELFAMLKKLDADRAVNIDAKNKVRLIRAIEIAKTGILPSQIIVDTESPYRTLFLGLDAEDEILKNKIQKRLVKRMDEGLPEEVAALHKSGITWKRLNEFGLEYRYISNMLLGKTTPEETVKLLSMEIWHFAKRQRTWFKRNKEINWLDASNKKIAYQKSEKLIKSFLTNN
jgi:tRNA dimethylallyltransferase